MPAPGRGTGPLAQQSWRHSGGCRVHPGPLRDRVHFGSDYPFGNPDSWLAEWDSLGLSEDLTRAVLVENFSALLAS